MTTCASANLTHISLCMYVCQFPEDRRLEIKLLPHGESNFCGICIILFSLNGVRGILFICLMFRPAQHSLLLKDHILKAVSTREFKVYSKKQKWSVV